MAIETETPPIPPHMQQQSTNSTCTLHSQRQARGGGANHNDLAMVWASAGLSKRVQRGEVTNGEVRCWMEVSHRLCSSLCTNAPLLINSRYIYRQHKHKIDFCFFSLSTSYASQ
jgi:hypothetical protein